MVSSPRSASYLYGADQSGGRSVGGGRKKSGKSNDDDDYQLLLPPALFTRKKNAFDSSIIDETAAAAVIAAVAAAAAAWAAIDNLNNRPRHTPRQKTSQPATRGARAEESNSCGSNWGKMQWKAEGVDVEEAGEGQRCCSRSLSIIKWRRS